MSFVRIRKTHPSGGIPRKKKTLKKLPEWDVSIAHNDSFPESTHGTS